MNPAALKYYKKWLQTRYSPFGLYVVICSIIAVFFLFLTVLFRLKLGNWGYTGTIAMLAAMATASGASLIWMIRMATTVGSWVALEGLESGYRAGHYREVWRALMIKYRGIPPEIIAGERFHRLLVAVGTDIVSHEILTSEQDQQMTELLATARINLQRNGGVTLSNSKAKYAKPILIAWFVTSALFAIVKIIEMSGKSF